MGYRILIIEDDENMANSLMRTLRNPDYNIELVKNVEDAMVHFQNFKVDLIVYDYKLSGTSGIDFLTAAHKQYPQIMVILLAGQGDFERTPDMMQKVSLYKLFVKPLDENELQTSVRMAFRKSNSIKSLENVCAADLMSKFPVTTKDFAPLSDAAELMMRFKISGLPVLSQEGKLIGIITATDLFKIMGEAQQRASLGEKSSLDDLRVGENMSRNVYIIKKEATLAEMIHLMFEKNIHTLPVVENDEMLGIVGRRDVLNAYYYNLRNAKNR